MSVDDFAQAFGELIAESHKNRRRAAASVRRPSNP